MAKNIDDLMKHLRNKHNISISGSSQKRELRNIGYFHGYKGYRFIKNKQARISFTNFDEILTFNEFDIKLKSIFYPHVMFLETAIKNYVLEEIIAHSSSSDIDNVIKSCLTHYKSLAVNSKGYKDELHKMLNTKNIINSTVARDYKKNKAVITHFLHSYKPIPIWAIFEIISMGELGSFVHSLDIDIKRKISSSLSFNQSLDTNGLLIEKIIYCLKDLRNAIAHNDVIFDVRFQSSGIDKIIGQNIQRDGNISNVDFKSIFDYFILVIFILKKLDVSKIKIKELVNTFEKNVDEFKSKIAINYFFSIFGTNYNNKLSSLKTYIQQENY